MDNTASMDTNGVRHSMLRQGRVENPEAEI
jgi:hypothetical protein